MRAGGGLRGFVRGSSCRVRIELKHQGVLIKGGAADEAPEVYKNLDEVLQSHEGTIKILNRLKPIGVAMAGAGEADPYKD